MPDDDYKYFESYLSENNISKDSAEARIAIIFWNAALLTASSFFGDCEGTDYSVVSKFNAKI